MKVSQPSVISGCAISGCPILRKRYGKEEMGEDWQKISHIPNICFDDYGRKNGRALYLTAWA